MISDTLEFDVELEIIATSGSYQPTYYEGPYAFTPSQESQTIPIAKLTAKENITVEPIPSNYGKVTQIGNSLVIE